MNRFGEYLSAFVKGLNNHLGNADQENLTLEQKVIEAAERGDLISFIQKEISNWPVVYKLAYEVIRVVYNSEPTFFFRYVGPGVDGTNLGAINTIGYSRLLERREQIDLEALETLLDKLRNLIVSNYIGYVEEDLSCKEIEKHLEAAIGYIREMEIAKIDAELVANMIKNTSVGKALVLIIHYAYLEDKGNAKLPSMFSEGNVEES